MNTLLLLLAGVGLLFLIGGIIGDAIDRAIFNRAEREDARRRNRP